MSGWQPIETAPRDRTHVLLGTVGDRDMSVAYWDGKTWQGAVNGFDAVRYMSDFGTDYLEHECPTHWVPLPPPPQAESL